MKFKSLKNLNLRKREMVEIEEGVFFPVRTLSIAEEASIKFNIEFGLPSKITTLTPAEKEEIIANDPNYNKQTYIATKVYDQTSPKYIAYLNKKEKYTPMLESLKFIDVSAEIETEDGKMPFWKSIGMSTEGDWLGLCEILENSGFSSNHAEKIIITVNKLKGDSVFQRIYKLQQITQMDYIELITALEEFMDTRQNASVNMDMMKSLDNLTKMFEQKKLAEDGKLSIKENTGNEGPAETEV
jgi:hypothetical protein